MVLQPREGFSSLLSMTADGFTVFSKLQPKINKNNLSGPDVVIVQFRLYDVILKDSLSFLSSNVFDKCLSLFMQSY